MFGHKTSRPHQFGGKLLHLSYYAKKLYVGCPYAWWVSYRVKRPKVEQDKRTAYEGSIWHMLMEDWQKVCPPAETPLTPYHYDESWLLDNFDRIVSEFLDKNLCHFKSDKEHLEANELASSYVKVGLRILKERGVLLKKRYAELSLDVKVSEGLSLTGRVDLVVEDEKMEIYDYKGSKEVRSLDFEQLGVYKVLVEGKFNKEVSGAHFLLGRYDALKSLDVLDWPKERVIESFTNVFNNIEASKFDPNPGRSCRYCNFKESCEYAYVKERNGSALLRRISRATRRRGKASGLKGQVNRIKI